MARPPVLAGVAIVAALMLGACTDGGGGETAASTTTAPSLPYEQAANEACDAANEAFGDVLNRFPGAVPPSSSEWASFLDELHSVGQLVLEAVGPGRTAPPQKPAEAQAWTTAMGEGQTLLTQARDHALAGRWPDVEATMSKRGALSARLQETASAAGLPSCASAMTRTAGINASAS